MIVIPGQHDEISLDFNVYSCRLVCVQCSDDIGTWHICLNNGSVNPD